MLYQVKYKVSGWDKEFESPTYDADEIQSQKDDITGYEGVYDVHIVPVTESI